MSTATTREHSLGTNPETGNLTLDAVDYTHLTLQEHRILEDLLVEANGPTVEHPDLPGRLSEPPF